MTDNAEGENVPDIVTPDEIDLDARHSLGCLIVLCGGEKSHSDIKWHRDRILLALGTALRLRRGLTEIPLCYPPVDPDLIGKE